MDKTVSMNICAACAVIVLCAAAFGSDGPTGQILRDVWDDIPGAAVSDLTGDPSFPKSPSSSGMLTNFEGPTDNGGNYGAMVRGYVYPPVNGQYTFWIASDDASELWLSTSEDPTKKVKIAAVTDWCAPKDWNHSPSQKSPPITLAAGKKYYIEALHKQGEGGANLAVGWTMPGNKEERPIPGNRLSPFKAEYVKRPPFVQPPVPATAGFHKLKFMAKVGDRKIMVPYVLYLPIDYEKTKDTYPLILFLHGAGEGGTDLNGIFVHGPAPQLQNNENFRKTFKFIGVFPQTVMGWDPPMSTAVLQTLDNVIGQARVDKDRVYCTGLSMGGRGTWIVAEEGWERFAAIIPMDPFAFNPEVAREKLKNVTEWIIVGAEDGDHTTGSKLMFKTLNEVKADVYLTVVPHCGHGAWGMFYPEFTVYDWLLKHRRGKNDRIPIPPCGILGTPDKVVLSAPANNGGVGSIRCEYFRGIGGTSIADLRNSPDFPADPSDVCYLQDMEIPGDQDDNYGTMLRGYIHPPASGQYTFWIATDDNGELWLSPSDKPEEKVKIATCGCAGSRQFDAAPEQKSKPITLVAGKKYYIEALQKEGGGADYLAVGWQTPDGKQERPILGEHLSPAAPLPKVSKPLPVAKLIGPLPTTPGHHKLKAELTINGQKSEMTYVLYLPKIYDKSQDPVPMFTFLHGNTHQGNDWTGVLNEGPAQFLNDNQALRDWMPMIGFFPQCPANQRWDNRDRIRDVIAIQDEICKQFRVDTQRVYCTGLSMGGMGTWYTALEAPDRFAAIAPISAIAVRPQQAVERLKNVPIWMIAGGNDGGFTEGTQKMKDAFDASGKKDLECTIVPGEGHGVWGRYYPEKRFYEWLLRRHKPGAAEVAVAKAPVAAPAVVTPVAPPPANATQPSPPAVATQAAVKVPTVSPVPITPPGVATLQANNKVPAPEAKPIATLATPEVPGSPKVSLTPLPPSGDSPAPVAEVHAARRIVSQNVTIELGLAAAFMGAALFLFMTPGRSSPRSKTAHATYRRDKKFQRTRAS